MSRAYSTVQKLEKRQEILMSAEDLFIKQDGEFPTVTSICLYSSIAKGTVYLYFKNKEEIYLALLEKYFLQWADPKKIHSKTDSIDEIIQLLIDFVSKNPYKFKLLNYRNILETRCDAEKVVAFYKNLMAAFTAFTTAMAKALNEDRQKAGQWLMDSYYFVQGLWRTANPAHNLKSALSNTEMAIFMPDFETNARRVLKQMWDSLD